MLIILNPEPIQFECNLKQALFSTTQHLCTYIISVYNKSEKYNTHADAVQLMNSMNCQKYANDIINTLNLEAHET